MKALLFGMCLFSLLLQWLPGANPPADPPGPAEAVHRIARGDTFALLAKRYGIPLEELLKLNPDCKPQSLQVGQIIRLGARQGPDAVPEPTAPAGKPETSPVKPSPAPAAADQGKDAPATVPETPSSETSPATRAAQTVTLGTSMTFGDFAELHGTDPRRLNQLNGLDLTDAVLLAKGTELYVPLRH